MKQYNLGGLGANVELGKQGPKIVGSDADQISLTDAGGNATVIVAAEGTEPTHAVLKSQLDRQLSKKIRFLNTTVRSSDGNVNLGTAPANTKIISVTVERVAAWTGFDSTTEITVGDSGDISRLYSEFDPEGSQTIESSNYVYSADTQLNAYVTTGSANAGTATITIKYVGPSEIV